MLFDLKDLKPTHDVSIELFISGRNKIVDIYFNNTLHDISNQLSKELSLVGINVNVMNKRWINIFVDNFLDEYQLAEIIAGSLEKAGLKVKRLVKTRIPGSKLDRSTNQEIQSFILA